MADRDDLKLIDGDITIVPTMKPVGLVVGTEMANINIIPKRTNPRKSYKGDYATMSGWIGEFPHYYRTGRIILMKVDGSPGLQKYGNIAYLNSCNEQIHDDEGG